MAKVREMAMPLPLAMSLVMAVAIAMPLPSAVAVAIPLFCGFRLNCRHLYYLWILKFYMETFWTAPP